jgi:hypothetical protein
MRRLTDRQMRHIKYSSLLYQYDKITGHIILTGRMICDLPTRESKSLINKGILTGRKIGSVTSTGNYEMSKAGCMVYMMVKDEGKDE